MKKVDRLLQRLRQESDPDRLHKLIDDTLRKINQTWSPGTLTWLRANQPKEYEKMKQLEGGINEAVAQADVTTLQGHLTQYEELLLQAVASCRDSLPPGSIQSEGK